MGFKENLKAELLYSGMRVKELAERSGVKKQTIDSYLRDKNYTPSVSAAVKIARALGVSVEYLVNGKEVPKSEPGLLGYELRLLIHALEQLNEDDRKVILNNALDLIKALQNRNK